MRMKDARKQLEAQLNDAETELAQADYDRQLASQKVDQIKGLLQAFAPTKRAEKPTPMPVERAARG